MVPTTLYVTARLAWLRAEPRRAQESTYSSRVDSQSIIDVEAARHCGLNASRSQDEETLAGIVTQIAQLVACSATASSSASSSTCSAHIEGQGGTLGRRALHHPIRNPLWRLRGALLLRGDAREWQ